MNHSNKKTLDKINAMSKEELRKAMAETIAKSISDLAHVVIEQRVKQWVEFIIDELETREKKQTVISDSVVKALKAECVNHVFGGINPLNSGRSSNKTFTIGLVESTVDYLIKAGYLDNAVEVKIGEKK